MVNIKDKGHEKCIDKYRSQAACRWGIPNPVTGQSIPYNKRRVSIKKDTVPVKPITVLVNIVLNKKQGDKGDE